MIRGFLFALVLVVTAGCSLKHCKGPIVTPTTPESPAPVGTTLAGGNKEEPTQRTWVCKYDGSVQCEQGRARALEVDGKELAGIQIFQKEKKRDNLMRIQVCGAQTGQANCFLIRSIDLAQAEEKGFRSWTFGN